MELRFDSKPMKYLKQTMQESKYREETMETIVPDSFPDADRILCGNAVVIMRSKECRAGSVSVSGGIRADLMYMAEGEKLPRHLELYLPYTVKAEHPALTEDSKVLFEAHTKSVDVRMVNCRKLMMRVNFCYTISAYDWCEEILNIPQECPEELQMHCVEYPMILPAETSERSFQMTEEIRIPGSRPLTGEIYHFLPQVEITEKRLAGNKAVFKGQVRCRVMYGTQEDALASHEFDLPFSQYCELMGNYGEEEWEIQPAITGCEVEKTATDEGDGLLVTMHLLVQCVVMERQNVTMAEDAYYLNGEFQPQWQEHSFYNRLDRQMLSRTVRDSREGNVSEVLSVWGQPDHVRVNRVPGGVELEAPVMLNVIYYDTDGQLQSASFRSEHKETLTLAENAECIAFCRLAGDVTAIPTGNTVELRYPIQITAQCCAMEKYRCLCGGEIAESASRRKTRPGVIVRRTRSEETLWDIAKSSGTTVEKIRQANRLDSDVTEAGILLIPM